MATVEFRDGPREIPDHLADMMRGIQTTRLTLDEATDAANKQLERNVIDRVADTVIRNHGRDFWGQR